MNKWLQSDFVLVCFSRKDQTIDIFKKLLYKSVSLDLGETQFGTSDELAKDIFNKTKE